MTENLSKGPNPSQEDRKQHQVTYRLFYSRDLPSKAYLFIDGNSPINFPFKLSHNAWTTCVKTSASSKAESFIHAQTHHSVSHDVYRWNVISLRLNALTT